MIKRSTNQTLTLNIMQYFLTIDHVQLVGQDITANGLMMLKRLNPPTFCVQQLSGHESRLRGQFPCEGEFCSIPDPRSDGKTPRVTIYLDGGT